MKKIIIAFSLFYILMSFNTLIAQSLVEIPLEQQIAKSSLIVEGKVISQKSFWGDNHRNIYTRNVIEVYKVFKGEKTEYLEVITLGGIVGLTAQNSSHSLQLFNGKQGLFMLKVSDKNSEGKSSFKQYEAYSGVQGFYVYNDVLNYTSNFFKSYNDIENSFYNTVQGITNKNYLKIKEKEITSRKDSKTLGEKTFLAVTITDIEPTTIAAGAKQRLTITGSGFGSEKGTIGFKNADDGGVTLTTEIMSPSVPTPLVSEIISWNDNTIVVEVPGNAGTGTVTVFHNSDNTSGESSETLSITYAEQNIISGGNSYQVQHINDNGSGGYTWEMYTDFFNDTEHPGAKAAFEKALDTWRCETRINWVISGSETDVDVIGTDTNIPPDGNLDPDITNIVRFDNGNELEDGVLGRCTSWYSGCDFGGGVIQWYVSELDIVFDDTANWYTGSNPESIGFLQYDFQSVALHELGHGHQLGHVIDNSPEVFNGNDVMHYAISNREYQRVLTANNIAGGNSVQSRSTSLPQACGRPLMTNSTICNLSTEENELANTIKIYPNPAQTQFFIKNEAFVRLQSVEIYDLSGRKIAEYDLSNSQKTKNFSVLGMAKGVYLVNIYSENAKISNKLVIE